jgi:DNA-binding MarR family transcriptional regulator
MAEALTHTQAGEALTDLILEIFRVNGDLLLAGDDLVKDLDQSSARWQVLGAIDNKSQTVAGIARDMGLTRQSVQRTADLLAVEGIVEYVDNPAHRRAKLVRLTPHGKRLLDQITSRQITWSNDLARTMPASAAEIRSAFEVMRRLRARLERNSRPSRPREVRAKSSTKTKGGVLDERRAHKPVRTVGR